MRPSVVPSAASHCSRTRHTPRAACALVASLLVLGLADPARVNAQATGIFTVMWRDSQTGPAQAQYFLHTLHGVFRLEVDDATLGAAGGLPALDRKRVQVTGRIAPAARVGPGVLSPESPSRIRVTSIQAIGELPHASLPGAPASAQLGNKHYLTVLCAFPDSSARPRTPAEYQAFMGPTYPALGAYWREQSYDQMNIDGSTADTAWVTLPHPASYYIDNDALVPAFSQDCAATIPDAELPRLAGVNFQSNAALRNSWGGGWVIIARNGIQYVIGATWMASWADERVYAHEMGHSLGWPHSTVRNGNGYGSKWDVMSSGVSEYSAELKTWTPPHTTMYHKNLAGWIAPARQFTPAPATATSIVLQQSARPGPTGYLVARIPIDSAPGTFYTVEARRRVGFDAGLPADAVILHTVDSTRPEPAHLVETGGPSGPTDADEEWTPGKRFVDARNGVLVRVDSATATGFGVTVEFGWRLGLTIHGPGSVSATPGAGAAAARQCDTTCGLLYATRGTALTLSTVPRPGNVFAGWAAGPCQMMSATCSVQLTSSQELEATFALPLVITADSIQPAGVMGALYSSMITTTGGGNPLTWRIVSGALPPGVKLDSGRGLVTGRLTRDGRYQATVEARWMGLSASKTLTFSVSRPTLAVGSVLDQLLLGQSTLTADEREFLDLQGNANGRIDVGDVRGWLRAGGVASATTDSLLSGHAPSQARARRIGPSPASRPASESRKSTPPP